MAELLADKRFELVDLTVGGVVSKERLTQRWTLSAAQSSGDDLVTHALPIPLKGDISLTFSEESGTLNSTALDVGLQTSEDGANWTYIGTTPANGQKAIVENINITSTPVTIVYDYDDDAMSGMGKYVRIAIDLGHNQTGAGVVKLIMNPHII